MNEIAKLTEDQLKKITDMEDELGVLLVAYEEHRDLTHNHKGSNHMEIDGSGI
ncbi:bifunctional pyridoxal-dependent enzyme with beta-cystathionase and maltose regulon repressor activities [Scopulibacillus daqui]|uniref:Bifunctional pyridoxal-dependent enzyme with beta-cystathionase and maltose regulon repressor activities n=1 Tax=Scopulibacillus daqui TaxID=1469162 RepID=A0ABS2Q116_9BACL|nr:hypothetical protein [Scopulibacillus daqui]MBM7645988.1 bifunctional pyridoxal-dependent enzyme with beta-cystathionase and maltose regulon repressor activities [Scopulibacillus daqui]